MRIVPPGVGFVLFYAILFLSRADNVPARQETVDPPSDAEIEERIVGTWASRGSYSNTNGSVSFFQTLTYSTNHCYSATETRDSARTTRTRKCEGFWSVKHGTLKYSITNSIGVKPDSEPFFCTQARVIRVDDKQLGLSEWMDQLSWFEKQTQSCRVLNPFRSIDYHAFTVKQLERQFGAPDADFMVSQGHDLLIYYLADDSCVTIETQGDFRILQVQHGKAVLFKQPWQPVDSWMKR